MINDIKNFDPASPAARAARRKAKLPSGTPYIPYLYSPETKLAVKVAGVTGRPLLLRGDPGCGKSTLARDVALALGYRYYEEVITSRTRAADLQWRFDAVRRLGDASVKASQVSETHRYLDPGVLWWAFQPESAQWRGLDPHAARKLGLTPIRDPGWSATDVNHGAVVLVDEIDKAEPDVPNDLLVPLGENRFRVNDPDVLVTLKRPTMVFITSNGERDLPAAFLRRCVVLDLPRPDDPQLKQIARLHFPTLGAKLVSEVLERLQYFADQTDETLGRKPGTAEFIDALKACSELTVDGKHPDWDFITSATLRKQRTPSDGSGLGP